MVEFTRKVICDCCGYEVEDLFGGYDTLSLTDEHRLYDICNGCSGILEDRRMLWEREVIGKIFYNKVGREDPEHE